MSINRRKFIRNTLFCGLPATTGLLNACSISPHQKHQTTNMVINANMVLSPEFVEPLNHTTKSQLSNTGLTAFKLSIGGSQGNFEQVKSALDSMHHLYEMNPGTFIHVNTYADLLIANAKKLIGIIYSFEAATMLTDDLEHIEYFAQKGVRIMQPGYNRTNAFGAGVMSSNHPLGLSPLGSEAIERMQMANVLVDLSHAHEQTAFDVLKISKRPVGITHTGCDAINQHPRNKSDKFLKSIADQGGVSGIYEMSYLTPDMKQQSLDSFMAHMFHAINVCGVDHVGIGSDTPILGFDTSPENLKQWDEINQKRKESGVAAPGEGPPPYVEGLNGPHKMIAIAEQLNRRGLTQSSVDKIMGNNFARLFKEAW